MTKSVARITLSLHALVGSLLWALGFFHDEINIDFEPVCIIIAVMIALAIWGKD